MSTRIMSLCWPLRMRPPAKSVLVSMADMANDEGYCWPSIERLCERTCFGRTAVIDAIAWLESRGAVRANRSNGRKTVYWVEPGKFVQDAWDAPGGDLDGGSDAPNQSATRTGSPPGPVRQPDPTSPPGGLNQSARRTLIVKNRHESLIPPLPPEAGGEDGFDEFKAEYPRQVAMSQARAVWVELAPTDALRKRIMSAVRAWSRSPEWQRNAGQYIPKASRWLREARWDDVPGLQIASASPEQTAQPPRPPAAQLTPEQLKANGDKARAAAAHARQAMGLRPAPCREHRARSVHELATSLAEAATA